MIRTFASRLAVVALVGVLMLSLTATGVAAGRGLRTNQLAHPGHSVDWVKGIGFPDGSKANQGLRIEKFDADASGHAGVAISGFTNPVSTLGFVLNGACDDGVWFSVGTTSGVQRYRCDGSTDPLAIASVTHTPVIAPDGTVWTEVRIEIPPTTVDRLHLLYSPPGRTGVVVLDDITVGELSVGKSGKG